MGKKVPVMYLDLDENSKVVLQDFFWVIKSASGANKIYSVGEQLMIFSSEEKALALVGRAISEYSTVEVLFWNEIVFYAPQIKIAVLDYGWSSNRSRICIDLDSEREDIIRAREKEKEKERGKEEKKEKA